MSQSDNLLDRLALIPERIAFAVAGWSEIDLHTRSATDQWSAAAIFAHLRASDDILTPRLFAILVRDKPALAAFDERRWAELAGYEQANFQTSLSLYTLRRAELITVLRRLEPADWQRTGLHETHGVISILQAVTYLVEHEEEHCRQLEAIRASFNAEQEP
jgi:hypothetical protein